MVMGLNHLKPNSSKSSGEFQSLKPEPPVPTDNYKKEGQNYLDPVTILPSSAPIRPHLVFLHSDLVVFAHIHSNPMPRSTLFLHLELLKSSDIPLDLVGHSTQINKDKSSPPLAVAHHRTRPNQPLTPPSPANSTRGGRLQVYSIPPDMSRSSPGWGQNRPRLTHRQS